MIQERKQKQKQMKTTNEDDELQTSFLKKKRNNFTKRMLPSIKFCLMQNSDNIEIYMLGLSVISSLKLLLPEDIIGVINDKWINVNIWNGGMAKLLADILTCYEVKVILCVMKKREQKMINEWIL